MKFRTFHNRIERREFEFDRADLHRLLQAEVTRYSTAPAAATVTWELVDEREFETEVLKSVTLVQVFEYLAPAVEQPLSADAVDPQAGSTGTLTTRER